jgi:putative ABC transport system permease protein
VLLLFRLAIKNLASSLVQSFITITGIALSIATILAVSTADNAVKHSVEKTIDELGTGKTDIWVQSSTENNPTAGSRDEGFDQELIKKIIGLPAVSSVHPMLKMKCTACHNHAEIDFFLYGIDLSVDAVVRNHILQKGNYPEKKNEIMIGEKLAQDLKLNIESAINIKTEKKRVRFTVSGLLKADIGSGLLHYNRVGFTNLSIVQQNFDYINKISALNIVLKKGFNISEAAGHIESLLPFNVSLYTDQLAISAENDQTKQLRVSSFIFSFISIFLAVFIIYNTLSTRIEQSKKQIALLRLIGMTNSEVVIYLFMQTACYACIACIAGIGLGLLMGSGLLYMVSVLVRFQTIFYVLPSFGDVLFACAVGFITTLLVGIIPAVRAAKTSPLDLFRQAQSLNQAKTNFSLKTGAGLLFILIHIMISLIPSENNIVTYVKIGTMLLLFVGLVMASGFFIPLILRLIKTPFQKIGGISGLIAVNTLTQKLKRTVLTIAAITITVGIISAYMGMTGNIKNTVSTWLDKTGWADVIVFSNTGAELHEALLPRLTQYEFIEEVNPLRYLFVPYEHESLSDDGFMLQACDIKNFFAFTDNHILEGNTERIIHHMENNPQSILLNENLAKKLQLRQGDSMLLKTKNGRKEFNIAGTIRDYTDFIHRLGKAAYCSEKTLTQFWEVKGYTLIQIKLTDTVSAAQAKGILAQDLKDDYNLKILTHDQEKKDVEAAIYAVFSIFFIINWILFIIVFLAVFQTIFINTLFQIYEFVVLRVVGGFNWQIRMIVLGQALLLSTVGGTLAVLCGAWLSCRFTQGAATAMGHIMCYFPLITMGVMVCACVFTAVAASLYPLRVATKYSITKVLQTIDQI